MALGRNIYQLAQLATGPLKALDELTLSEKKSKGIVDLSKKTMLDNLLKTLKGKKEESEARLKRRSREPWKKIAGALSMFDPTGIVKGFLQGYDVRDRKKAMESLKLSKDFKDKYTGGFLEKGLRDYTGDIEKKSEEFGKFGTVFEEFSKGVVLDKITKIGGRAEFSDIGKEVGKFKEAGGVGEYAKGKFKEKVADPWRGMVDKGKERRAGRLKDKLIKKAYKEADKKITGEDKLHLLAERRGDRLIGREDRIVGLGQEDDYLNIAGKPRDRGRLVKKYGLSEDTDKDLKRIGIKQNQDGTINHEFVNIKTGDKIVKTTSSLEDAIISERGVSGKIRDEKQQGFAKAYLDKETEITSDYDKRKGRFSKFPLQTKKNEESKTEQTDSNQAEKGKFLRFLSGVGEDDRQDQMLRLLYGTGLLGEDEKLMKGGPSDYFSHLIRQYGL